MIDADQFEAMTRVLYFSVGSASGDPDEWDRLQTGSKNSWREVVARQLKAAGVEFERPAIVDGW